MKITISYFADTHGAIEGEGQVGGFAHLETLILERKQFNPSEIILFGGDLIGSFPLSNHFKALPDIDIFTRWPIEAFALGNHDFDYEIQGLRDIIQEFQKRLVHPPEFISANIDTTQEDALHNLIKPYFLKEELGLAIIGFLTLEAQQSSRAGKNISFEEPKETLKRLIPLLKKQGITKFIILSHLGYPIEQNLAHFILENFDNDFVILGSHTHTTLGEGLNEMLFGPSQGPYPTLVENNKHKVIIISPSYYGQILAHLEIEYNEDSNITYYSKNDFTVVDQSKIKPSQKVIEIIQKYRKKLLKDEPTFYDLVASTKVHIVGYSSFGFCKVLEGIVRREESIATNLTADGYYHYASNVLQEKVDFALFLAGGFRTDIRCGNIKMWQLHQALPFEHQKIVILQLSGKEIQNVLQEGLSEKHYRRRGLFLIGSKGFKYYYKHYDELDHPDEVPLERITLNEKQIEKNKKYKIVVNSFMTGHNGNVPTYPTLHKASLDETSCTNTNIRDVEALIYECTLYSKTKKEIDVSLLEGRISSNLQPLRQETNCCLDLYPNDEIHNLAKLIRWPKELQVSTPKCTEDLKSPIHTIS